MDDIDNEKDVLCERIINAIHAVFHKDAGLSSFEIIPTVHNCNKSPVVHIEHNLGLESWCAKHVYDHAHKQLMHYRSKQMQQRLPQQQFNNKQQQYESDVLVKYLNVALLLNPDVTTFWHIRRQLVQKNRLKITKEFQFAALVLSKKPKSNEAFAYRRWLFSFQSSESIDWPHEICLCERCADRCSSNYHAWSHRQWVLQNAPNLLQSELIRSEKFMLKHISDYSSCHYRQFLLHRAHELCYYDANELEHLSGLIPRYIKKILLGECPTPDTVFHILLPNVNATTISPQRIKCLLYCINMAAHDMLVCENQQQLYGERECISLHRRAMLKFIVEQIVRYTLEERIGLYLPSPTGQQAQEFQIKLRKYDFTTNEFLDTLLRSECAEHGSKKHLQWLELCLGYTHSDYID